MKKNIESIIALILIVVLLFSCNKQDEVTEEPVVYDETGLLGLADSPWPCDGYNSRRTSQSPYNGPIGNINAEFIYDSSPGFHISDAVSPAIDAEGNLYCAAWVSLLKFSNTHDYQWENDANLYMTQIPAISKDGTIYIAGFYQYGVQNYTEGEVVALDPSNNVKWEFEFPDEHDGGTWGAPAIGSNGTVYVVDKSDGLFAINKQGKKVWSYQLERSSYSSPAVAPDGTIHVVDYDDNLYAIKPNGDFYWKYAAGKDIHYDPVVGVDGTVYIGSENSLLAVGLNGEKLWEYSLPEESINRPSIATDGTIYIACADQKLYAINANGTYKWDYAAGGYTTSPVTIDASGNIYFGTNDEEGKIISISKDGQFNWEYPLWIGHGQPVINSNSTLYIGTMDGKIYALTTNKSNINLK